MYSLVFWLKHPSPPWHAPNAVQAMLTLWHPHLLDLHGMSLSQEHLIVFNISSGARVTFISNSSCIRDVEPSRLLVHPRERRGGREREREVVDLRTFRAFPFPIPWYIATVSHPVRPWDARRCPMIVLRPVSATFPVSKREFPISQPVWF